MNREQINILNFFKCLSGSIEKLGGIGANLEL